MIDFTNGAYFKLVGCAPETFSGMITPILLDDEMIISTFKTIRDGVIFTNKRIITINVQGITGKKKDFTSLPYSKIQAFSVETAGTFDFDSELDLFFSGLGKVRLEFSADCNITRLAQIIGEYALK